MSKTPMERLAERVQEAATEILSLKKERGRLNAEVDLMTEENRRARRLLREYEELLKERRKVQVKLEQLHEKLDRLKI